MRLIDADALIADLLTVDPRYTEMVEWCCNVIRQTPTIEPTDTDLISRADAIKGIRKCKFESDMPSDWYKGMEEAQSIIEALPSVDAVHGDECDHCVYKWGTKGGDDECV